MHAFVFDGQGSTPSSTLSSTSPLGALFLQECNTAFSGRIRSLSGEEVTKTGLTKEALDGIVFPVARDDLPKHPLVSMPNLFVEQMLRLIHLLETHPDVLSCCGGADSMHVLGYSSGLLAALFMATSSPSTLSCRVSFTKNSLFFFNAAVSLGLHSQISRFDLFNSAGINLDDPEREWNWSSVVLGLELCELDGLVRTFNENYVCPSDKQLLSVAITAHTTPTSHTISGFPSAVRAFSAFLRDVKASSVQATGPHSFSFQSATGIPCSFKPLNIFSLFHVDSAHMQAIRDTVLSELYPQPANISDIETPSLNPLSSSMQFADPFILYDTFSGAAIDPSLRGKELVKCILDMILIQPVRFTNVTKTIASCFSSEFKLEPRISNLGQGSSLARIVARALKTPIQSIVDHPVTSSNSTSTTTTEDPIAIVGMAVNLPGARDTAELWKLLERGLNTLEEIPDSRFSVQSYSASTFQVRTGNFLPDSLHSRFDNSFFKISPREATSMDPQMRVLMRVGLQAMEAAGLVVSSSETAADEGAMGSDDVGCFVGVATNDYMLNLHNDINVHYATGTLPAFLAGRLAYALNLSGPCAVVNTACSSSMVAIYQACRALMAGDCKAALAGGVNVITSPDMYNGLERAHFLSPGSQCKPWDASADGYSRAEGCGVFVLKRLSQAIADSDNILGLIRGVEVNQSSAAASITRPHGPTQERLFRSLLQKAGVKPEDVSVVEAHGTGTQAGDPEEIQSLRAALRSPTDNKRSHNKALNVTSIKGNIGHAEAASGAASLAKVLLMFRHQAIPPQVGLQNLNPKIADLAVDGTNIHTGSDCLSWEATSPRIALVNNFGAAGSNAALLVEEPSALSSPVADDSTDSFVLGLSAETKEAALRLRDSYVAQLASESKSVLDFAYTATARRTLRPWRICASGDSRDALVKQLTIAKPVQAPVVADHKKIVFVFSGQGAQYIGMGQQLYTVSATFKAVVDECHSKLVSWGYPGVLSVISTSSSVEVKSGEADKITSSQCAMFVLECALFKLWESWGVKPDAIVGHSLGEYAALVAAGVLTIDDGLRLVAHRARLMAEKCQQSFSGMVVVRLAPHIISDIMANLPGCGALSIACYNGGKSVVIGGPLEQLTTLTDFLDMNDCKYASLQVPFAYHTAAMDAILEDLDGFARKIDVAAPSVPILSNVTGKVVLPGDASVFTQEYFSKHCRQPVRFDEGIRSLVSSLPKGSIGTWIELGPHSATLSMLTPYLSGALALSSLNRKSNNRSTLCDSLARLFTSRGDIKWGRVYRELYPSARVSEIPGYPLSEKEFWVSYCDNQTSSPPCESSPLSRYAFLDTWTQRPSSMDANVSIFETPINQLSDYITGHRVISHPLCPASVYHELALSAATCTLGLVDKTFIQELVTLSDLQFTHPLVYDKDVPLVIRTAINLHPVGSKYAGSFTISSVLKGEEVNIHCTGFFGRKTKAALEAKLQMHGSTVERSKDSLLDPVTGSQNETLKTRTIYELVFSRIVQYSKQYQIIRSMTMNDWQGDAIANVQLPREASSEGFVAQPIFVDSLLHAAGFVINSHVADGDAYICSQVGSSKVLADMDYSAHFEIYCTTSNVGDGVVLADAWAIQCGESNKVVAHVKRMRFTRLRTSGLQKLLSRSGDGSPSSIFSTPSVKSLRSPFRFSPRPNIQATPYTPATETVVNSPKDVESEVMKVIADTCGVPLEEIDSSSNIAALGVDSLIWIELIGHLKSSMMGEIDTSFLMQSLTVGDLADRLMQRTKPLPFPFAKPSSLPFEHPVRVHAMESPASPTPVGPVGELSSMQSEVKVILGDVLGISPLELAASDRLEDLGLDSIGTIEAMNSLQALSSVSLPSDLLVTHPTVNAIVSFLSEPAPCEPPSLVLPQAKPAPIPEVSIPKNVLSLQTTAKGAASLFLVHDGSGLSNCYSRIGALDRSLFGISNPKLLSGGNWKGGLPEIAGYYRAQITPMVTEAGCILGGWSFGGVVAFHMACEMQKAGVKVAGVVLIDSPSPFTHNSLPEKLIDTVLRGDSQSSGSTVVRKAKSDISRLARLQMRNSTKALVEYNPLTHAAIAEAVDFPPVVMLRCEKGYDVSGKIGGPSDPFLEDRRNPKTIVRDWERMTGTAIPVLDIPGHHFEPFHPKNVGTVTKQLQKAIQIIENANTQRQI